MGACLAAIYMVGGRARSDGPGGEPRSGGSPEDSGSVDDPIAGGRSGLLPYVPAIDGLRALAVTAVLIYHADIGFLSGGFIGVDIFFVISGYLITSLLLSERDGGDGRVNLLSFWGRRARRLLPALFALIGGTLLYTVIFLPDEVSSLRGDALAGLAYVANWHLIFEDKSYFEALGRPSMMRHLWSLAVEEQFYVFFPLIFAVVLARLRVRYALAAIVALALASAALMALLFEPGVDPSRVYYGTDTRISVILAGVALAFIWRPGRLPSGAARATSLIADAYGLAALIGLVTVALAATEDGAFLYHGGFLITAVLASVLIAATVHPGATLLSALLSWRPLVWLGTRSYSIYLWHWPVFMLTRPGEDVSLSGVELLAVRLAITVALAELSFRLVEAPIRTGSLKKLWLAVSQGVRSSGFADYRRLAAVGSSAGLAVFLAISVAAAEPPPLPSYLQAGQVQTVTWSRTISGTPTPAAGTSSPSPSPSPTPQPATPTPTPEPSRTTAPTAVATVTPVPVTAAPTPQPAPTPPPAPPSDINQRIFALGDSVMLGASNQLRNTMGNLEMDAAVSRQVSEGISILRARRAAGLLGDAVIIHLGNNGTFTSGQLDQIMSLLDGVERVIFVTVKVPRDWEGPNNSVINSAASYPNAVVVDWYSIGHQNPAFFYDDRIHLRPDGASYYAGLLAQHLQPAEQEST